MTTKMVSKGYRPNVGIMVINKEGLVWIGHRIVDATSETPGTDYLWQMPQGGVDKGEELEPAARRELLEETGISSITLIDQTDDWLKYDFPEEAQQARIAQKYRGQKQMWFVYRFEGDDSEVCLDSAPDQHNAEFDEWRWEKIQNLPELIIPFKKEIYRTLATRFANWAA